MSTVALYTLGCKLNFSESSSIGRMFKEDGHAIAPFESGADIYIINTCSVTENADKKCRKIVKDALKLNPNAFICIIGCYAQLKPKEISRIPGVDAVLGASEKFKILELIKDFKKSDIPQVLSQDIKKATEFSNAYSINDRTRTFLKVQDGCNYNCSFCTIPLARGKSRSDTIENIINSAKKIALTDVKEVVLTGVNIGDFGIIEGKRQEKFIDLLTQLDEIKGISRFRISSIEPNLLTNEIIDFVAKSKRFVPHFHIPLQSGNDELLTSMRRRYNRDLYTERVNHIKQVMPDCCIGVDVIVGYPGETEEHFLDTYNYLNELPISYLHVFTYSERDNTHAVTLDGVVAQKNRADRSKMLRTLSEKKKRQFYLENIDRTDVVLFEGNKEKEIIEGFTRNYVKVRTTYDEALVNQELKIQIKDINANTVADILMKQEA